MFLSSDSEFGDTSLVTCRFKTFQVGDEFSFTCKLLSEIWAIDRPVMSYPRLSSPTSGSLLRIER